MMEFADLRVQRPKIIEIAQSQKTESKQVHEPRSPFAHVKPVNSKNAKKREQQPSHVVVQLSRYETAISVRIHRRDEKQIDDPADQKEAPG